MPAGFARALEAGRLLFDGPIGTELLSRGQRPPLEELNASAPAMVREVHKSYLAAGARVLRANTLLAREGAVEDAPRLARLGVALARETAGADVWVGASLGAPSPPPAAGRERLPAPGYAEAVAGQVAALAAAEPDFLSFETFLRPEDLDAALAAGRAGFAGPLVAFFTLRADVPARVDAMSVQRIYATLARFLEVADARGVTAVGVNCVPPGAALELARDFLAREAAQPWGLLPSAPGHAAGHEARPGAGAGPAEGERFVLAACEAALDAGASFLGGCCGVGPGTVQRLGKLLRSPLEHMQEEAARRERFEKRAGPEPSAAPRGGVRGRGARGLAPSGRWDAARGPRERGPRGGERRPRSGDDRARPPADRARPGQPPRRWDPRGPRAGERGPRPPDPRPGQERRSRPWEERPPRQGRGPGRPDPRRGDPRARPPEERASRQGEGGSGRPGRRAPRGPGPGTRGESGPPGPERGRPRSDRGRGVPPLWSKRPSDAARPERGESRGSRPDRPDRREGRPGSDRPWRPPGKQRPDGGRRGKGAPGAGRPPRPGGGPARDGGSEPGSRRPPDEGPNGA